MPVLSELGSGTFELGGSEAENLSEGVCVLLQASVSAVVLFTKKVDVGDSPSVEFSQGENCDFD